MRKMLLLLSVFICMGMVLSAEVRFGERPFIDIYKVPDEAFEQDRINIKLAPKYSINADLVHSLIITERSFGITELDGLNSKYLVKQVKPIFPNPSQNSPARTSHHEWGLHLWFELRLDGGQNIRDIVMEYRKLGDIVHWAEPVYKKTQDGVEINSLKPNIQRLRKEKVFTKWTPNDYFYSTHQWDLNNTGQTNGTPDCDIDMPEAWEIEKGHSEVVVCVEDGGIDLDHSDLSSHIWINPGEIPGNNIDDDSNDYIDDINGWDFVSDDASIEPHDHGSHVSGTISAVTNNNTGVAGIAGGSGSGDGVRLMSCQVFTGETGGDFASPYSYAAANGAAISQNSWGYTYVGVYEQAVLTAIDYFNANGGGSVMSGGITVFAAGNNGQTGNWYPACYSGSFAVASTDHNDVKASSSNYGTWVAVSAPGVDIVNTGGDNNYYYMSGTSMACPHVSGVAALVLSYAYRNGTILTNSELRQILLNSVDDHYDVNLVVYTGLLGTGRINAYTALLNTQSYLGGINNPLAFVAMPVSPYQIDLSWNQNNNNDNVLVAWSADGVFGAPVDGIAYSSGNTIPGGGSVLYNGSLVTYNHTGLDPSTTYHYKAWSVHDDGAKALAYSSGVETNATTYMIDTSDEGYEYGSSGWPYSGWNLSTTGSADWFIQSNTVFAGTYAAQSGAIADDQSCTMTYNVTFPVDTVVSFYQKVSSEAGYDGLVFAVDGVTQDSWSGISGIWSREAFSVPAGTRTLAWTYVKNATISAGSDCAWVDYINFEAGTINDIFVLNENWESGSDGWTAVNGTQTNKWILGTATYSSASHSMYVSNDNGTSNAYTQNSSSVVHVYHDVDFASGVDEFILQFAFKGNGQVVSGSVYDGMDVYLLPTSVTPVAGTDLYTNYSSYFLGSLAGEASWITVSASLGSSYAGTSQRLTFQWFNNQNQGTQPPAAIDEIQIYYSEEVLPIELSSFTAAISADNYVNLTWVTQTETGVQGFYVLRNDSDDLATALTVSELVPATNTSQQQTYAFTDRELQEEGTYYYWLQNTDLDGTVDFHGPVSIAYSSLGAGTPSIPLATALYPAYPNPFNPSTTLSYSLAEPSAVGIDIYNQRGQIVRSYSQDHSAAGHFSLSFDGRDSNGEPLSSGIYLYRMRAGAFSQFRKMVLCK
ncbi:MAG: S8 family serine peptidase [Candidatus Cloacimonetes bacterium]|nr:S8 family serine peptidase [Candidatus Cloacimonadota bacterium]